MSIAAAKATDKPLSQRFSLPERVSGRIWRELNRLLPKNRLGDNALTWLRFVTSYRRFPDRNSMLFNDRLYRIKTSDDLLEPLRSFTSDKDLLKLYVAATVGEAYNVPTFAVLSTEPECRSFSFPERCVIKATHCSGATILRRRGEQLDLDTICSWFSINYHASSRERNYRHLIPKVIVEPFVFDDENPNDYKIFCVDGVPRMIQVDSDRHIAHTRCLFDAGWRLVPYAYRYPMSATPPARPKNLDAMLEIASRLSARFAFVRVDLYSDGRELFIGELTHCPESGRGHFLPQGGERFVSALLFGESKDNHAGLLEQ